MKFNNKKVNAERDTQNEIGRKVLKGKLRAGDLSNLKVESEDESNLSRSGRKRRSARANRVIPRGKLTATVTPKKETPRSKKNTPASKRQSSRTLKRKIKEESDSEEEYKEDEDEEDDDDEIDGRKYVTPRRRVLRTPKYDDSDFEQSDDDDSYHPSMETPSKKPRVSNRRNSAVNQAWGGNLAPPRRRLFPESTSSVPEPLRTPSQMGVFPPPSSHLMPSAYAGSPETPYDPAKDRKGLSTEFKEIYDGYRSILCGLLDIETAVGRKYTLNDLRRYARAYNRSFARVSYSNPETPGWEYLGPSATYQDEGVTVEHFTQLLPQFTALAKARGDLSDSGVYDPNGPSAYGFAMTDTDWENRALGFTENQFGILRELYGENDQPADSDDEN